MELAKLKEQDELFRQVMKVHHETVETYLEDVVLNAVEKTADQQARAIVREYAQKLNTIVDTQP